MQIPSGLRAFLSQMGLMQPGAGQGQGQVAKGKASAMKAAPGPATGRVLGEDGQLLAGLGYAGDDKHTNLKNVAERKNLTRFFQEQLRNLPAGPHGSLLGEEGRARSEANEGPRPGAEAGEGADAREAGTEAQEARPQEARRDEGRIQGQREATENAERRDTSEAGEPDSPHQHDEQDEEDKPGAGWVAEENEEEGDEKKRALREADVLGPTSRCRGELEDGTRCLRKPTDGTPYCAEHAARWRSPEAPGQIS